jgi:hypothetical protein
MEHIMDPRRFASVRSILCLLLVLASPSLGWSEEKPDLYILSVGIDVYQPPTNRLHGCVNDAAGLAQLLQAQQDKRFGRTESVVLTDAKATHQAILAGFKDLEGKGKAGDWYVIVLSGHGGITRHQWTFLAHDNRHVTETALLSLADRLAGSGKKVLVLIDACHAGQLRYAASALLNRHTDPKAGGIVLMVSSMSGQLSDALGPYSAFARAVEEGLSGLADYDNDRAVTLQELRRFTFNRVYELRLKNRPFPGLTVDPQDSAIDASLSFPETTALVHTKKPPASAVTDDGPEISSPDLTERTWKVTLPGTPRSLPLTYQLRLDPFGYYTATLSEGNRPVKSSAGAYKVTARAVQLIHPQGVDRLEVVAINASEFRFRFQGRAFKLHAHTSAAILVDVSGRLGQEDPRDRVRKTSPHKVYTVNLEAGVPHVMDLQSPDFDTYLRLEDSEGVQLAEDDDGGGGLNSRLVYTPTHSGPFRVIVTTFHGGSGVYHLRVEKATGPQPAVR